MKFKIKKNLKKNKISFNKMLMKINNNKMKILINYKIQILRYLFNRILFTVLKIFKESLILQIKLKFKDERVGFE